MDRRAFTLIELLVVMSVLTLVVLMLTQVFGGVASSASMSSRRLQENSDVRSAMDRLSFDFGAVPHGGGTTPIFKSNVNGGNNDAIAFVSNVRAMNGTNYTRLASVCYTIGAATKDATLTSTEAATLGTQPVLLRGNHPLEWTDDLTAFTSPQSNTGDPTTAVTTYQVLNPDIFRIEIYFQMVDGTLSSYPGSSSTSVDWSLVQSVHIALAALDQTTRKTMTPAQIATLCGTATGATTSAGLLGDFVASNFKNGSDSTTPVTVWTQQLLNPASGIPPQALKAVRFYERSYDLH